MKFQLRGEARLTKPMLQLRKIKKVFTKFSPSFWRFQQNFNGSKIVLSPSRGQGNFRGSKASRPRLRTSKCVLEDSTSGPKLSGSKLPAAKSVLSSNATPNKIFRLGNKLSQS